MTKKWRPKGNPYPTDDELSDLAAQLQKDANRRSAYEQWHMLLPTLGGIMLAMLVGWLALVAIPSNSCAVKADKMEMASDWGIITGCMVQTPRGWRPIESIRQVDE